MSDTPLHPSKRPHVRSSALSDELVSRLLSIPGIEERKSRFQDSDALWYAGKEFLHFDRSDLVDLRLGRRVIRAHRESSLKDKRISTRDQSDWLNVRISTPEDVELIVELVSALLLK